MTSTPAAPSAPLSVPRRRRSRSLLGVVLALALGAGVGATVYEFPGRSWWGAFTGAE